MLTDGLKSIQDRLRREVAEMKACLDRVTKPDDYDCDYHNAWVVPARRALSNAEDRLDLFNEVVGEFRTILETALEVKEVSNDSDCEAE